MSEESNDAARAADTPGAWLKQERERLGIARQRIADDLHLSTQMIDAIEANQFSHLGAPVYARGHLRKYAQLLNLPVERVHEMYQALNDRPRNVDPVPVMHRASEPSIPMSPDSQQRRAAQHPKRRLVVLAAALVIVFAVAAWWWWQSRSQPTVTAENSTEQAAVVSLTEATTALSAPVLQTVSTVKTNQPTPTLPSVTPVPQIASNAAALATVNGKIRLRFAFSQESWIEVYDARGTRVLYDVGQPRQTRSISVDAPAKVTLGAANAVTTEVNGRALNVPARSIANSVAHFTIASNGSLE